MRITLAPLLSLVALAACMPASETPEQMAARNQAITDSVRTWITSMAPRFAAGVTSNNTDSVVQFYASDAVLMAPNVPAATGHDAIKATLTSIMTAAPASRLDINVQSVSAAGDVAIERGTYVIVVKPAGAPSAVTDSGNYVVHWKRDGNSWKMADHAWNSSNPVMPMARR